ncbi:MAG TPA: hypothetical protein VE954_11400 [Oligoflexus sp.]|uniref:hypothetical protein n=1 Tax=Oligoflexus sp. TaxID=1971216 RepID=UPI002D2E4822|nr:hypothetical protein [Oligoflexus sp.]HYX33710.1 hypothetical protein [Oligoflexus sp.]
MLTNGLFQKPDDDDWFEGRSVGLSPSGLIWLWSQEKVAFWGEKDWQVFPRKGLPLDTYVNPSILFDKAGRIWIPTRLEEAFSVFDPENLTFNTVKFSPSILTEYTMYEDSSRNLWEISESRVKAVHFEIGDRVKGVSTD